MPTNEHASARPHWKFYLALSLLAFVCLGAACNKSVQATGADPGQSQAFPVKVQLAKAQRVAQYTEYIATLKSRNSSVLQPQVEGQVTHIFVRSGDRVQAGAPLLQIDPLRQQATVSNQEASRRARLANLEWAAKELQRRKDLFAAGVISRQELDQAQTAYEAAQADLDAMEAGVREQQVQLKYYRVRTPEAGIVGDIPVRVGDRVSTDTVLTTLDKGGELEAYISIPAEKSSLVRMGTQVEILDENDKPAARGKVSFISPRVDTETQLLLIKATVPNQERRFRNAQVVHARVLWDEAERPVIPVTAVARVSGQTFAYLAEGEANKTVARQRAVRLGEIVGNDYVVLEGIKPGERVITSGVQMLADGMPVAPQS
jgi:RND family efflux transporter MFP subunit